MHLAALALIAMTAPLSDAAAPPDICGVWVTHPASNLGVLTAPDRVLLSVTRDGNRLKVIEIVREAIGSRVVERQYLFSLGTGTAESNVGTARTAGRETLLRRSDQIDRWRMSRHGSELIVERWPGTASGGPQKTFTLRRADRIGN